ncbi:MAG: hypothetical protein JO308_15485 [Verrucomicrobia bacterium]|nr:hypothetical protein [Verrucomicrobiota bacterium]
MNPKIIPFPSVNSTASAKLLRMAGREAYDPTELFLAIWFGTAGLVGALLCASQFIGHTI